VRITLGGNNAGFISLHAALAYLEAHPDQTVWVMNWDAPGRPKSMQINENLVLLVLAGPDYKAERASLAWMSYPATRKVADFETGKDQPPRAMQAWQAVFVEAARHGRKTEEDIGYVIHDANKTLPTSSERLARLAQALNWKCPASTSCRRPSIRRPCWAKWAPARRCRPGHRPCESRGPTRAGGGHQRSGQRHRRAGLAACKVRPIDHDKPWFRARERTTPICPGGASATTRRTTCRAIPNKALATLRGRRAPPQLVLAQIQPLQLT
jgi:hypothetical protein